MNDASFLNVLFNAWQTLEFLTPWMLAALPLPWVIRLLIKPAEQHQTPLLAPHLVQRLGRQSQQENWLQPNTKRQRIPFILVLLWLLMVLAAMRPVWFLSNEPFTATGKDLMLAVDLSGSMEKNDMPLKGEDVDRLTAVKYVVSDFILQR